MALSKTSDGTIVATGAGDVAAAFQSFEQFLSASADVVDALGEVVDRAGRLEKATGVTMQDMSKAFLSADIDKFLQALGPDLAPLFVKVSLRLGAFGKVDIDKLSPDEKIVFGAQTKELASDLRRLLEGMRAAFRKQKAP